MHVINWLRYFRLQSYALIMASKEFSCVIFVCLLSLGSAKYCTYSSSCGRSETCCSDNVCRDNCYYCTYNYQCGTGEECCNNKCKSSCVWGAGSIVGAVISTIIFFAIIITIASCCCCACCPYYRYRTPGAVVVTPQLYQPYVSNHAYMTTMQQVQIPPPVNYNQPLPGYIQPPSGHNQPPPPYPGHLPPLTQHPPPQGETQSGAMPVAVIAAQPVRN